jgi:PAS domain S-box-containing protein
MRQLWFRPIRWIQQNTFAPRWLPEQLRRPLSGYLIAILIEVVAVALILLILSTAPTFDFSPILPLTGVVLIALGWGTGPSLVALLLGTLLLDMLVLTPRFSWVVDDPADGMGLVLYLVVGVGVSLLAGRSERARREAENTARLLTQVDARSRLDSERLRTVLDVLPATVLITNQEGQLLEMNLATSALWGGDLASGTNIPQFLQEKSRQLRSGQPLAPEEWPLARTLTSGQAVQNDEIEIETFDGQRKVILYSAVPLRDLSGRLNGAVVTMQDISVRHRLEQEVAERAHELEAIFEAMTDGIAFLDLQGNLVRTNRAFRTLHGVQEDSAFLTLPLEQRMARLALADEQGHAVSVEDWPLSRLLRGKTLAPGVDITIQALDGREVVLNVGGAPIHDQHGHVTGTVEVFRDVTARQHTEQRTREILGAVVAMAEAMVQSRPTTVPAEASAEDVIGPAASASTPLVASRLAEVTRRVLGCRSVSIAAVDSLSQQLHPVTQVGLPGDQGRAWWASWSPPQRLEEHYGSTIADALAAGQAALLEPQTLAEHSLSILYGARSGQVVPMQLGEELVGILTVDYREPNLNYSTVEETLLTETLARLGALVLEQDRLLRGWAEARANELALGETKAQMDTFLGIASHELKTPLTSLKLSLQVGERRLRQLTQGKNGEPAESDSRLQPVREHLSRSIHQMERLERLVNDLLDVSRIQAGKLALRLDHVHLESIVGEAVEMQRQVAPERTIHLQLPDDVPVPVYADAGRMEQVVTNFLINALKYSYPDRPIDVGVEVELQQARVWVQDQGPGLSVEEQEHIWERFHRAKGVEVQAGAGIGLGLGLYISRMIVERHQGQVGVESAFGKGSTFWFTLPLTSPEEEGSSGEAL